MSMFNAQDPNKGFMNELSASNYAIMCGFDVRDNVATRPDMPESSFTLKLIDKLWFWVRDTNVRYVREP